MSRKKKSAIPLPTTSIGGATIPTGTNSVATTTGTVHIQKPASILTNPIEAKPSINKPLDIQKDRNAFDNEYVELAKRYLGIPIERTPTMVEFAKYVINVIDMKNKIIEKLSRPRNDVVNRIYSSYETNGSWN